MEASLVTGLHRKICGGRGPKRRGDMYRGRDGRAGELAPAPLLAVLLDHVPERDQVQRVQHLIPPLPLALCPFITFGILSGQGQPPGHTLAFWLYSSVNAELTDTPKDKCIFTLCPCVANLDE